MAIKITRTLFVGLGGTGVKAILRAKQCFVDAYGEVPPMVAFLAIDTDRAIRDKFLISRNGKEVRFSQNEICFCGISGNALDIYRNYLNKFQWLPRRNAQFLANLKNTGAGQVRSNGRFLARHNATNISYLVSSKVNEIGQPLPVGCRFEYDTNKDGVEYPTKVNVVGSIAGGTGSGTMLDMLVLIAKTLRNSGLAYSITPWMVLPDVFRHMAAGPATANVFQNSYGTIRELDYLYHLPKDNQNPLDFDFDKVDYLDDGIGDTYLINNTNSAGVVFQNIDDLTDSIGRCMFLPSNENDSVMDNTGNIDFVYSIRNKEAHYMSAGSAELVYDNQAVGNVIAKGIIAQICDELVKSSSIDAISEVNAWTKSEAVAIQEHDADQLIDSILPQYAPFSIIIDKDSDVNAIKANINAGAEAPNIISEVKSNEEQKLKTVKEELLNKIQEILNTQNGVGGAKAFLESLSDNIAICRVEMVKEAEELAKVLAYSVNWEGEISNLKSGIFKSFDKDAAEALQQRIAEHIAQKRDLLRHNWAIQFYTDLDSYVNELLQGVNVFKTNIESTARSQRRDVAEIQQLATSSSKFQIYLHADEASRFNLPAVDETSANFRNKFPIYSLVHKTDTELREIFFDFAKDQQAVVAAVNVSIEQKLRSMPDNELRQIFSKIKEMSSPLWKTNTLGYLEHAQEMTTIFTIGVYDQASGIIQEKYKDEFTLGAFKPTFASTHETDRITFFQTQCSSPAYAVTNMPGYRKDAEQKLNNEEAYPVFYLDEKWNQRMIVEGFDLMPKQEKDRVLPNWVNAVVYGFIKFDEERRTYYIESDQGDILAGGFLELGQRRDLAFDQFQLKGLDREVEKRLQKMILEQGGPAVTEIIKACKADIKNYVSKYAQLSKIEFDRISAKDQAYKMVRDMLEKEVSYLKELNF